MEAIARIGVRGGENVNFDIIAGCFFRRQKGRFYSITGIGERLPHTYRFQSRNEFRK